MKPPHYAGSYHVRSRQLKAHANANPETRCWRCGLTRNEYAAIHGDRPARWTAGHIHDGEVEGPLMPEHHRCNSSAGATMGNQRRQRNQTSRQW